MFRSTLICVALLSLVTTSLRAETRCFTLEFLYDSSVDEAAELRESLDEYAAGRGGLNVVHRDVATDESARKHADAVAKYFGLKNLALPAVYGANHVVAGLKTEEQLQSRMNQILTMTAYVRNGCPHCRDAKAFLAKQADRYPALRIDYREIVSDASARKDMNAVVKRYGQRAATVPVLHFCNQVTVGYDTDSRMGKRILQKLDEWSKPCPAAAAVRDSSGN